MDKKLILRRMRKSKFFMTGFIVALIIILLAILAPVIIQFDPMKNSLREKFLAPQGFVNGLSGHIFGTDQMGRDIFSRLLTGARYSLIIAAVVVACDTVIGSTLGLVSGYFGGIVDVLIMRGTEVFMCIPQLVLAIAVIALLGANMTNLILVLIVTGWMSYAKLARNNVMVVKNIEFVKASKILGATRRHIIFEQILPNVTTPLLIQMSNHIGMVIMTEAALSFLNLGIQAPTPSWGNMIADGREYMLSYPWMVIAPGLALMLTVLAFNFLGDGLRDVLDPKRT